MLTDWRKEFDLLTISISGHFEDYRNFTDSSFPHEVYAKMATVTRMKLLENTIQQRMTFHAVRSVFMSDVIGRSGFLAGAGFFDSDNILYNGPLVLK